EYTIPLEYSLTKGFRCLSRLVLLCYNEKRWTRSFSCSDIPGCDNRNVWLKSPPMIMILPLNKAYGLSKISFRQQSRASKQRRSFIGASSQMMRGILNRECVVLPDGNSNDAIPEDATASTILSSKRRAHAMDFHRKVLHVPP
ncbi:hypothetical protein Tco_1579969, partial [Tanacetum coccineum]